MSRQRPRRPTLRRPASEPSVTELGAAAVDEGLQLRLQVAGHLRLLVLGDGLLPDLVGPRGRVLAAVAGPALVVLGGRHERTVEALAEALQRVHRAQEVAAVAHL